VQDLGGSLKVERVGIEDNFFDLGVHALLGHEVASLVGNSLGVGIPLECYSNPNRRPPWPKASRGLKAAMESRA